MDADSQLLTRYALTRDADAFTQLVRRHAAMVFSVAQRITRNHHDAEEVTQGCFMELARQAGAIHGSLAGWLHTAAAHRAANANRDRQRRYLREQAAAKSEIQIDGGWSEVAPLVDAALAQLPDELRLPAILYYLHGRAQAEVAAELGITQSTVSRRLEAAVAALRVKLEASSVIAPCAALPALLAQHGALAMPNSLVAGLGKLAMAGLAPAAPGTTSAGVASGLSSLGAKSGTVLGTKVAAALVLTAAVSTMAVRLMPTGQQAMVATTVETMDARPVVAPKDALVHLEGIHSVSFKIIKNTFFRGIGLRHRVGEGLVVADPPRMRKVIQQGKRKYIYITDWVAGRTLRLSPVDKSGRISILGDTVEEGNLLAQLRRFAAGDFDQVGKKEIDGSTAIGYHAKHTGADADGDDQTIWVDEKTRLPVLIEMKSIAYGRSSETLSDFKWNVPYDDAAFSLAPPGYHIDVDSIPKSLPTESDFIEALRLTAQSNKNTFLDHLDMQSVMDWLKPETKTKSQPGFEDHSTIINGLSFTHRYDLHDWHYAGKGVLLDQPNTPIVWYKPKDSGNYRVINADLTVHEVAADALPGVASDEFRNAASNDQGLVPRFLAKLPHEVATAAQTFKRSPWPWICWVATIAAFATAGLLWLRQHRHQPAGAPLRGFQGPPRHM